MQSILWSIYIICVIIWFLPPFRQYKTRYFYYFLALGLADPLIAVLHEMFQCPIWIGHVITTYIYMVLLLGMDFKKRKIIITACFTILLISVYLQLTDTTLYYAVALNMIIISSIVAKDFVINIKETESINTFYIVLLLYTFSGIMKVLFRANYDVKGYLYFFLTNFFQIFIAIYFSIYNVNNSKKYALPGNIPDEA